MKNSRWRFLVIPILFFFFVLAPLALGAYWVRDIGIITGNAVIFSDDSSNVEKMMATILHGVYGDQVQLCDGDADDVEINAAIAEVCTGDPDGALVDCRKGTYYIEDEILLYHDLTVQGAGTDCTIFKQTDGADIDAVFYNIPNGFNRGELRNFAIDGNNGNNTAGYGVWLRGAWYSRIVNLYIHDCETYGIRLTTTSGGTTSGECYLEDCYVTTTTGTGVGFSISGAGDSFLVNCSTYNNSGVGFHIGSSANTLISCHPYSDGSHGIQIDAAADHTACIECHLDDNGKHGIIVNGDECRIIGCYAFSNSVDFAGYDGIRVTGTYNTIQGNTCINLAGFATQTYGIQESGAADYNTYTGNVVTGTTPNLTAGMLLVGTHNSVFGNVGYVSEARGSGTLLNTQTSVIIDHGLSGTPTAVTITWRENPTNAIGDWWISSENATSFTLNGVDPGASNLDFWWEARLW